MKYNYPVDAYDDESYGEFIERKKAEEASASLAVLLFIGIFKFLRMLIVYSPILLIGYYFTQKLIVYKTNEARFLVVIVLLSYILYALVYALKGSLIKLREKRNGIWLLIWIICVICTCILPVLFVQNLIESMFRPDQRLLSNAQTISWTIGILVGFYVYACYKFLTPVVPRIVKWSYELGYGFA